MILVDTSVWVSHFSRGGPELVSELEKNAVLMHPFVLGELALGRFSNRVETLNLLENLPLAEQAENQEVMTLIEDERLYSQGIGWVDVHLLASARLSESSLWTLDRALMKAAKALGVLFED